MALQTTYTQFQPAGYPGMSANMEEWNGITRTATATIAYGAPAQRSGDTQCAPFTTGEFIGVAIAHHVLTSTNADSYGQYDNVPLADAGVFFGLADAAIAAGAALNWNSTTGRWTTAAVAGAIYAVPQAEADNAASGAGVIFKVRLRRIPA
ncbi:structural cement protein Gp24 [Sphingomonas sp. PB4P5]|uniref:structural cement protein Gp24 n=1 Tax=Parasphingomonas puruogangriensis TaxID=3096155 RepID=UPI002FCBB686